MIESKPFFPEGETAEREVLLLLFFFLCSLSSSSSRFRPKRPAHAASAPRFDSQRRRGRRAVFHLGDQRGVEGAEACDRVEFGEKESERNCLISPSTTTTTQRDERHRRRATARLSLTLFLSTFLFLLLLLLLTPFSPTIHKLKIPTQQNSRRHLHPRRRRRGRHRPPLLVPCRSLLFVRRQGRLWWHRPVRPVLPRRRPDRQGLRADVRGVPHRRLHDLDAPGGGALLKRLLRRTCFFWEEFSLSRENRFFFFPSFLIVVRGGLVVRNRKVSTLHFTSPLLCIDHLKARERMRE